MAFKFIDRVIKPQRFTQIKFIADFIQGMKNFMRTGIIGLITNDEIL